MRRDMPKKFLEPGSESRCTTRYPRSSKKLQPKGEDGVRDFDDHGMQKVWKAFGKYGWKSVGTDFSLLRRFLMKRKGRPWDDVYSEICEHADAKSFEGHHLRNWLSYAVTQNCFIGEDGVVRDEHGHELGKWWCQFYVHPETKTLEWIQPKRKNKKEKVQTVFELDGQLYHKHDDGLWYRVRFNLVPEGSYWWEMRFTDAFWTEKQMVKMAPWSIRSLVQVLIQKYGVGDDKKARYCCWKQSANSNEIAKIKAKYGLT